MSGTSHLWTVRRDGAGRLVIVNASGQHVLRESDPIIRLQAFYLAAAAPALHDVLERMAARFARFHEQLPDRRDAGLLMEAHAAIGDSLVPMEEVKRAGRNRPQLEIELDPDQG
jgi:hypothetical protein